MNEPFQKITLADGSGREMDFVRPTESSEEVIITAHEGGITTGVRTLCQLARALDTANPGAN